MSSTQLPWMDLSPYKLMAQLSVDKKGNQALLIRPANLNENPDISEKRAALLHQRFETVAGKVGNGMFRPRLLRGQVNVLTGRMIGNPSSMHQFLKKMFPQARAIEVTVEQMQQIDAIREAAKEVKANEAVTEDGPINIESLNKHSPDAVRFDLRENHFISYVDNLTPEWTPADETLTNRQARPLVEAAIKRFVTARNTDRLENVITRLDTLKKDLDNDNLPYWLSVTGEAEISLLEHQRNVILNEIEELVADRPETLANKQNLLRYLKQQKVTLGSVKLDNLENRIAELSEQVARELEGGNPDTGLDNVQDNGGSAPDAVVQDEGGSGVEGAESVSGKDNVQDEGGRRVVGTNLSGETIYQDANGVRSIERGGVQVEESVDLVPTRDRGYVPSVNADNRDLEYRTVAEALDAPASVLSLARKIRAGVEHGTPGSNGWTALTIKHGDAEPDHYLARELDTGIVQVLTLLADRLEDNGPIKLLGGLSRITPDNSFQSGGLPAEASDAFIKHWKSFGLPVPQTQHTDAGVDQNAGTVDGEPTTKGTEDDDDRTQQPAGTDSADSERAGEPDSDPSASGSDGGDGDRGVSVGDGRGRPGGPVPDSLGDRDESGEPDAGRNGPELSDSQSGTEATGDQPGADVHAGEDSAGTGSGGNGVGTGSDPEPGDTGSDTQNAEQADDGRNAGVSGSDAGGIPSGVADQSAVPGSDASDRGRETTASDGDGSEPGATAATESGTADHSDGADRGRDQSSATDTGASDSSGAPEGLERDGADTPDSGDGGDSVRGEGDSGEDDWRRFAEQQAAERPDRPEPFRGRPEIEQRGPAERLKDNINAILRLHQIETNEEEPSDEDREILGRYSGFGGIHSRMFTYNAPEFARKGQESLMEMTRNNVISSDEYASIRSTILTAFYTHSGVVEPMWEAIGRMGISMDRILEPSAGLLNFKSYMPESMIDKVGKFTAVEIDSLSARMSAALHPDARVIGEKFERAQFPDSFFDLSISNIPFGDFQVYNPEHPQRRDSIHNAFFIKALDKVREGGVVAFVTSSYVLDASDNSIRQEIMDRSHVAGVYRLPSETFGDTTGTQVVSDIIVLQKKGDYTPNYEPLDILDTAETRVTFNGEGASSGVMIHDGARYESGDTIPMTMNKVFVDQRYRVLGEMTARLGRFGPEMSVRSGIREIGEQKAMISEALKNSLPVNIAQPKAPVFDPKTLNAVENGEQDTPLSEIPGALSIKNNKLLIATLGNDGEITHEAAPLPKTKSLVQRALSATQVMIALNDLLEKEASGKVSDDELDQDRENVQQMIAAWEKLEINKKPLPKKVASLIQGDPRARKVNVLDLVNENGEIRRPDIVYGRTINPVTSAPETAESLDHALALSLAYLGDVSDSYIANLMSSEDKPVSPEDVRQQLVKEGMAFVDPQTGQLVERSVYLSGNLRPKIDACRSIVDSDEQFQHNLEQLEAALPAPLTPSQIKVSVDAFWLPEKVVNQFLQEALGLQTTGTWGVTAKFDDFMRTWRLESSAVSAKPSLARIADEQGHVCRSRFGTDRKSALELLSCAFTNVIPKVMDKIPDTEPPRYKINASETLKAQAKYEEIVDAFDRWVFKDPKRAQQLTDIYNERFNTTVMYDPDGSHMVYPGMSDKYIPRKHQNDYIWRAVSGKNSLSAHCVGAGKTLELIGTAVRGKQMGRWNKPIVVVPNHMLDQFANDAADIYPNAKILVMTAADGRASNREAFAAKCAMGSWDLVICTHSTFEKITVPQEFEVDLINKELNKMRDALSREETNKRPKEVEKAIKRMEAKLERLLDNIRKGTENILNMREIGIDFIGIDEAHYFKNLMVDTSSQIPGVSNASSKRAMNMHIRCQYLNELHGGPYGVMFATGTPISNSMVELYTFNRMLRPDLLEEAGIMNFNDWMGLFGEVHHGMEIKPEGGGYQMKSRLSRFKNIPELVKMVRTFMDVKTREDLNLPTPEMTHEQIAAPQSEFMQGFMKYIEARARSVRNNQGNQNDEDSAPSGGAAEIIATEIREALYQANDKSILDNETGEVDPDMVEPPAKDILLTIATDGRKASLDPRLIHPKFPDAENSKVNITVDRLMKRYEEYDEQKAAQIIFCDFSSPTGNGRFNVYDDIKSKLVAKGVPEQEVAFIHDCKTDADKEDLFARVRSGEVRFLLGSTQKMGVGTNVQERLVGLSHLDAPWTPSSVDQRNGRIQRQGNSFDNAHIDVMTTEDSFDLFMWETLNRKLKMISQAMRNPEDCVREINEETEPGYEEVLAIATGNPKIRDFMDARVKLDKLKRMQDSHLDQQADLSTQIDKQREKVNTIKAYLETKIEEQELVQQNTPLSLMLDGPVPGLCDGPMGVTGGLENLGHALKTLTDQAKAFRTSTIGTFGGLTVKIGRMRSDPSLIVERLDGRDEEIFKVGLGDADDMASDTDEQTEYYEAAKALVRYTRRIGRDNGIDNTTGAVEAAKGNLERLEEDLGKPFLYEQELAEVREEFKALSEELGDAIDEEKTLDPWPLVAFAEQIAEATGERKHKELAERARTLAKAESSDSLSTFLAEERDQTLTSLIDDDDDDDLDEDLSESVA